MRTGEIVLIPFPFSELTHVKARPAVLIAETKDKYADLVLAAITSQVRTSLNETEIFLTPSLINGLRLPSIIKVDRIFTLKRNKVIHLLGEITAEKLSRFKRIFKSLVD